MDYNTYKTYLKDQYLHEIRPLQSVNNVITMFQQKLDIVETKLSESELIFLTMAAINYVSAYKNISTEINLDNLNFISYAVSKNEKSDYYYNFMKKVAPDSTRIIILIEPKLNRITSNCEELKVDMLIERGIDTYHVNQETAEFFAYLMLLDTRNQN